MTKTYYIIFNLIALTLIIYTGVDIFYTITKSRLETAIPPAMETQEAPQAQTVRKPPFPAYQLINTRNLFGSVEKSAEPKDVDVENLEETALKVQLLGTVAGPEDVSRAVILDETTRKQGLYKTGDSIQDALIKKILHEQVVLRVGDKDEILKMPEPSSDTGRGMPRFRPQDRSNRFSQALGQSSTRTPTITVSRADIQEALKDVNQLLTQARVQPHFKNGIPDGLAISRIKRGSIFSKLGLRNGDVIKEVNGKTIGNPEDIFSMYEQLKTGTASAVTITRRGREQSMNYQFR